jgi:hypothetical protein
MALKRAAMSGMDGISSVVDKMYNELGGKFLNFLRIQVESERVLWTVPAAPKRMEASHG